MAAVCTFCQNWLELFLFQKATFHRFYFQFFENKKCTAHQREPLRFGSNSKSITPPPQTFCNSESFVFVLFIFLS